MANAGPVAVVKSVGISPVLGLPSHWSYSVASERKAHALLRSAPDPDYNTDTEDVGPGDVIRAEEEEETPPPAQTYSFFPDEGGAEQLITVR